MANGNQLSLNVAKMQLNFLVSYVEERPWWPIQRPNRGRRGKTKGYEEREIGSNLLILDLKGGNF